MTDFIQYLADLGALTWLFLGGMVLLFIVLSVLLLWPLSRTVFRLASGVTRLERDTEPIKQMPFPQSQHLRELWTSYARRAHRISLEAEPERVLARYLADPSEFFTTEAVAGRVNLRLAEAVPGTETALGILGTFFGILIGLADLQLGNPERTMSSIQGLLDGMATAFVTSVVGIVLALTWLFVLRAVRNQLDTAALSFARTVAERYPPLRPEEALNAMIMAGAKQAALAGGIQKSITEQKAELQRVGSDIKEALERTLNTVYSEHFSPAFASLTQAVEGFSAKVAERETTALGEMVGSFRDNLSEAVTNEYRSMSEAMAAAAEMQESTTSNLSRLLEQLEKASEGHVGLVDATTTAAERFATSTSGLADTHAAIRDTAVQVQRLVEASGTLAAEAHAQAAVLSSAHDGLRMRLAEQLDQVSHQVSELRAFWLQLEQPLGSLSGQLKDSMQEFSQFTSEKLAEVFARFDSELARVVDHLSGSLAEIRESTLELAPSTSRLQATMDGAVGHFTELEQALREFVAAAEQLRASAREVSSHLPEHRAAISQVSEGITRLTAMLPAATGTAHQPGDGRSAAVVTPGAPVR